MAVPCGVTCKIGPSILNADLSELYSESQRLLDSGADYLHLDVMDGYFVPNLTFGHPVVKCLRRKIPNAFFDLHMMVQNPEQWVVPMADAGASQYTFHLEATNEPFELIRKIKEAGMKVGAGIKPGTPVEELLPVLEHVDMVLIMTVEPGFGGQSFMADMMPKVQYIRSKYKDLDIEVDGGVGPATIDLCAESYQQTICTISIGLEQYGVNVCDSPVHQKLIAAGFHAHRPGKKAKITPAMAKKRGQWIKEVNEQFGNDRTKAGANMIVSGTAVINSDNPRQVISVLRRSVEEAMQKAQLER